MTVIDWISSDEKELEEMEVSLGGLGGWFKDGMRWKDYIENLSEHKIPYAEAMRKSVIDKAIKHGGDWHQNSDEGTPLFSDNTVASFSFRAWGDILAAIWSTEENKDYCYMDFYVEGILSRRK